MFISKEILVENVINRDRFKEIILKTNQKPNEIIQKVISVSHLVIGPNINIKVCRDPKDNKFIECAINANANYLVSGDEDLLSLKRHKEIKIVKSSEILSKI